MRRARRSASSSGESETRDLSVHGRRAVADGDVRLQAPTQPAERRAAPDSVRQGQRLTGMSGNSRRCRSRARTSASASTRQRAWVCDLLPHTDRIVDDLASSARCSPRRFNHDPAITFFQSGSQVRRPAEQGAWVHYGLGTLTTTTCRPSSSSSRPARWTAVVLALVGQRVSTVAAPGVQSGAAGMRAVPGESRWRDPPRAGGCCWIGCENCMRTPPNGSRQEVARASRSTRCVYRMQSSGPGVMRVEGDARDLRALTGRTRARPGRFAANCLLARRLAERGVKFHPAHHHGLGPERQPAARHRAAGRETDQRARPHHRPQATRPARGHASSSGAGSSAGPATRRAS